MAHLNMYTQGGSPTDMANQRILKQALDLSAQASQADRSGNIEQAIQLHNRCVELKIQLFGERSIQAALSFNELGECYLRSNDLEAAQIALKKALKVRDYRSAGGLEIGPRFDAAVSRDYYAQLKEAQGHFIGARKFRKRGQDRGEMACGNNKCPGQMFSSNQMHQCGSCWCVFYCSAACQRADWSPRHKALCQQHGAAAKAALEA